MCDIRDVYFNVFVSNAPVEIVRLKDPTTLGFLNTTFSVTGSRSGAI